jgi:VCBS repeat-containing protein
VKKTNNIRNHANPILLSLFSAGLAGCSTVDTATTGTAYKGLLDNAEVFIDVDGDGVWTVGVDSDKVRTEADGSFSIDTELSGDIVVQTDETTIDASSGAILAGIKMSAMAGSSVVTVATTITNELVDSSGGTLSQAKAEAQVKAILGLDTSTDVSSYNAYAAANAGTAESVAFEKSAQQVMTVINTLAEAEATSSIGSTVSKSAALNNAVAAFVDVIEAKVVAAGSDPVTAIDFKEADIINEVVAAAVVNDAGSVFADSTFTTSLTSIKIAIQTVNTAIDAVTSLDSSSKQTFAVAQSSLIDMTQAVASTNDASNASITASTNISTLVVINGVTAGLTAEDAASVTETGSLVLTGTALVTDPDTADNVTYTFDTTAVSIGSDSTSGNPIGTLTITVKGVWTYTLDNNHADVQALGASGSLVEVFQIKTIATDATDPDNLTTADSSTKFISVRVVGSNDTPTLSAALGDVSTAEDASFSLTIPSATFADVDTGDASTLTATLEGGAELPSWLTFTASTGVLSGTPTNDQVGSINITVTSTDASKASVSDTFTITVTNTNDAPTVSAEIVDQTIAEDSALSFTIPSATFSDVDTGDTSTLTATLTGGGDLPSWLTFTAATGVLSGTPTNDEVGSINITVTSTDASAASVADSFSLTTTNTNDAPTVTAAQTALETSENVAFSYAVPNATFGDIDVGDSLTYSATLTSGGALPAWLSFDASTKTFSGTPANSDIADLSIKVTASDGIATVSDTLALTVTDNAVPTVAVAQADLTGTEDSVFTSYIVPTGTFSDLEDLDSSLTITATGLPDGLTFADGTISGTPTNAAVGANVVSIIATDSGSASVTDQITITVANVNDAPTVANELIDQTIISGRESTYTIASDSFSDIDIGETATLAYSVTLAGGGDLPSWLSPNGDGSFSANPTASDAGTISVTVTATDTAAAAVSDTFDIIVTANQAPAVATLGNQTATEDTAVSFTLADAKFTDGNSDTMTVTVSGEPTWLTFDANTKTFSGTPTTDSDAGTSTITVTATDASTASGTATFDLVTTAANDAPAFTSASSVNVTENSFTAATVVVSDEESDTLTYSLSGTDASSFSIDSSTGKLSFSGSPRTDMVMLLDSSGNPGALLADNYTSTITGSVTLVTMDLYALPKAGGAESLAGFQFKQTSSDSAADMSIVKDSSIGGAFTNNGGQSIWYDTSGSNSLGAVKIGTITIANYDAAETYSIETIKMDGGDDGTSSSARLTTNNLIINSVTDLPAASSTYSVDVTATDSNDSTSSVTQTLSITVDAAAANANSSTSTATWTGTASADTYTIDSLTASADGGDGGNDVAKISIANHTTWDTTGGTTELTASLVDMEIIDIGNVISSNDSSAIVIGDFSTHMTIDATSAASMIAGSDSTVSIMGTTNDIVTLSGTAWTKGASSSLSSGDYSAQVLDAWSDGTSTLYIDHEINITTPDIA